MSCPNCGWPEPSGICPDCGAFIPKNFQREAGEDADDGEDSFAERCDFAAEEHFSDLSDLAERRLRWLPPN